jgi:hypothetical protein
VKEIAMSSRKIVLSLCATLPFASAVSACSGYDGSLFKGDANTNNSTPGPDNPVGDITGNGGPSGTNAACVTSTANAALAPVNLVVMFDRSGSMGSTTEGFDPALKWIPVTTGMKAFFADPNSIGIAASLQFFPEGGDLNAVCNYAYGSPMVSLTPLASSAPIVAAIDATTPSGGTPTLPALTGAVTYAQSVAQQHPTDKTVVVLVTDGEPGFGINGQFAMGCANNDIPHVAAVAQAATTGAPAIKTYVIGVGSDLTDLNAIASAGGTGQAIMVSVADPTQTKAIFQQALESIRAQTLSCEFALPPPPDGKTIDVNAVNVVYTNGGGSQTVLTYNGDCAGGVGWHYDNLAAPTKVELCASTCNSVDSDRKGSLSLAFGCKTLGPIR